MDIGREEDEVVVEPLEDPFAPDVEESDEAETPVEIPEEVPAA